ncbi:MAG: preprotein translocase subunit SecG [Flavobacteriales bacterium]|nr:preprotein translocase subunit SecG [Flavobacteriales bacterium]
MGTLITVLIFLVSILLGVIVLIQNPKGGGLGAGFGNVNQIGGVQRTADFLEKATWSLAIGLVVLCLASSWHLSTMKTDSVDTQDIETIEAPVSTDDAAEEEDF